MDHGASATPALPAPRAEAAPHGDALRGKLVWLTVFRIATITVLLGGTVAVNWQFGASAAPVVAPLYAVVAATYGASLVLAALLALRRAERFVAVAQVVLDVGIATAVVAITGLSDSVFVVMYLLAIVNGAVVIPRVGAGVALALAVAAYGGVILALHPAPAAVRGNLFAHTAGFVAVAALAGYLAEQLRRTGERLAERESDLAAVTALHESIVQSVTSGLLTLDPGGRVTFLNRAGEHITGLSRDAVTGTSAERWFPPFGETSRGEVELVRPGGERRLLGYTVFPLLAHAAAPAGRAVIFQDLTELRAMEETVRRSQRLADLGQVAAGLAHELRNPLASISGCVELLRGAAGHTPEDQRMLGIVLRETARLDELLTRFLAFSRPTPPEPRLADLAVVAGETLDVFAADPAAAGLAVERALAPTRLRCDPDQLRQVLWNLLSNAAHAMRESGRAGSIRVRCAPQPGGGAVLSVEDDGPGLAPDVAARIFTPFFTTRPRGTGLGLAEVQRIVDAHGGTIAVETAASGGARFAVRLPGGAPAPDPR